VSITHLPGSVNPDELAAVIGRDGAAVVDGVAPAALLDRIEAELRPYLRATPTAPTTSAAAAPGGRAR